MRLSQSAIAEALELRVIQRVATTGHIKLPAVPSLLDEYVKLCAAVFGASGRGFHASEVDRAREALGDALRAAFSGSPRSKIEILFEAEPARPLGFAVKPEVLRIADAYERWIGTSEGPLFGAHPDARVVAALGDASTRSDDHPILDFGAATGRNALALARLGHPVDAVEITPKFAEMLTAAAAEEGLPLRVVAKDVFVDRSELRRDYRLLIASEVVPDFRGGAELRQLFELANDVLVDGGLLLFNVHLCAQGYNPDKAARELSQQCYSSLFTPSEVTEAAAGLPFSLESNDSVHDYEREHLPDGTFPPTPWYVNWTTGLDVFELDVTDSPVELCWLAYRKRSGAAAARETRESAVSAVSQRRVRRFDPSALRRALAKRLLRRMNAAGSLVLPAIPAMLANYVGYFAALLRALGRPVEPERASEFSSNLERVLGEAYSRSQRSNVIVTYEAPATKDLKYTIAADPVPLQRAYEQWEQTAPEPMFGWHPDARLLALLVELQPPPGCRVLDVGAGTGRNALHLAQLGYPVDAVELTQSFARSMDAEARRKSLPSRVLERDVFESLDEIRRDYRLVLASGTISDFRDCGQLRRFLEIAAEVLVPGGLLLASIHVALDGYPLDDRVRQWGQQCCAMPFTTTEIEAASQALPFEQVSIVSTHDYEREHLPADAWPPTPVFTEWATAQHLFALPAGQCPVELRWYLFRRRD